MQFALSVPNFAQWGDPAVHVDLARLAEASGWDGYFIWDHIRIGEWAGPVLDPWVTLGAVAVVTDRIRIGPMVTPIPRRRPTKLARETVTLDHLSDGRCVLGVGIGTPRDVEFGDLGDAEDDRVRAAQLDEGLDLLVRLWTGEPVDHRGDHYTVKNATFAPRPVQEPRIPIWVGGAWPHLRPMRRAARWDGVVPITREGDEHRPCTPAELESVVEYVTQNRSTDGAFDVVASGSTLGDGGAAESVSQRAEVGATWWMENIGWPPAEIEVWRSHIAACPPR